MTDRSDRALPVSTNEPPALFEPRTSEFAEDPYPTYARLRAEAPVHWSEQLRAWVVSRYADCVRVLTDHTYFSSDYREFGGDLSPQSTCIQSLEPPEHTPLRSVLVESFRSVIDKDFTDRVRLMAEAALDAVAGHDADAVDELFLPLTTKVALELLGVSVEGSKLADISAAVVRSMMAKVEHDAAQPGMAARQEMAEILEEQFTSAELMPTGLLSAVRAHPDSAAVNHRYLVNSFRVVLLAGINSTHRYLANSLLALLTVPDGLRLFAEAANTTRSLHELARFDGPFQAQEKVVRVDIQIGDALLRSGDYVVALVGSANRDEAVMSEPDRLLLSRVRNPHLGFGVGHHYCLGAPLALVIGRAVLSGLCARFPGAALADAPVRDSNPTLRGLLRLPVAFR